MADESGLVTAARFERERRAERCPVLIAEGADAEALCLDYQCWVAITEWIETERFFSFAGGADPERDGAPIVNWETLELAAEGALLSVNGKIHRMEAAAEQDAEKLGALRQRRSCLWTIHRKIALRRQSIDTINAEFRTRQSQPEGISA